MLHVYLNIYVPSLQSNPRVFLPFPRTSKCPHTLQSIWMFLRPACPKTQPPGPKLENISMGEHRGAKKASRVRRHCLCSQGKPAGVEFRPMMVACRPGRAWGGRACWRTFRLKRRGWSCTGPTDDSATSPTERLSWWKSSKQADTVKIEAGLIFKRNTRLPEIWGTFRFIRDKTAKDTHKMASSEFYSAIKREKWSQFCRNMWSSH